jgi:hypothetical protein
MLRKSGASKIYSIEIRESRSSFAKKIGADFTYNGSITPIDKITDETKNPLKNFVKRNSYEE